MPNRLLTIKEANQMLLDDLKRFSGGDVRKMREFIYDFQTLVGGFPASVKERKKYIETGK